MKTASFVLLIVFSLSGAVLLAQYQGFEMCLGCHHGGFGSDKTSWRSTVPCRLAITP